MALFALNLILSGRFKFMEDYFGGLNKMYVLHHLTGATAFVFLLFHPLFLAGHYILFSLRQAALFLLPSGHWPINFGIAALAIMIILLILTFYTNLHYPVWKTSHRFLGLAFFFGGLHAFFIGSDIASNLPLKIYMVILTILGLVTFIYRSVFHKILVKKFNYQLEQVIPLGEKVVEITLKPQGKTIQFEAGQFIFVEFLQKGFTESHPFSISSSSTDQTNLKLTIKALGDYTSKLAILKIGTKVKIEGPFGRFSYKNCHNKNQIWIAGGIGITPFLSMAPTINDQYKIDLYCCFKTSAENFLLNKLQKIATQNNQLRIISWPSNKKGRLKAEVIAEMSQGLNNKDIFICGPPAMLKSLKKQFIKLKIPKKLIHSEEFTLL
ncbi:MAG: ferric reductase [Candidatus Komeilibacteria bacterium CG11_big_fil_rev_8_21_14_0_20_36_20]|uniref:Ferric reductase n=1 Tax=Candidatus Komeilibacteria bacterium CG11_big_fil_rev_8_21_14_0_20_36_20 TaxID=1974477 RepID=A0A2H0NGP3_9BACT|nr:MAG: ferric reductase [Candidatus Komeilibacteria bacterium CG11_big_fil_rev_8_21_14_0_20_36_20]PIR81691.1 MAG: ferric reductase [Candidatus Komeilibacteria bacterium CG10_big_fil_rev_8_21_14_0_10_36_65]PJC55622.1 MAG: ferric reductase [Candidatus Komeilibacteria bacterium CG_4_9_14_0_2_um_filter_36_13]